MKNPMTPIESLQHIAKHDKGIAAAILADFAKPLDEITEADISQTMSPEGLTALRQYADRLYRQQFVSTKRERQWRHKGRP